MSPPQLTAAYFAIRLAETVRKHHPDWPAEQCFDVAFRLIHRVDELYAKERSRE